MSRPGGLELGDGRPPRGGTALLALGALLLVAGIALGVFGIVRAVQGHSGIGENAVGDGVVRDGPGDPVRFESDDDEQSVYLDFDGVSGNSSLRDRTVAAVECEVESDDGEVFTLRGSRQGTAATVGDYASVGTFSASSGEISCGFVGGSSRAIPEAVPYLVTPGSTGQATGPVLVIIGGVAVGLLGGWVGFLGWSRFRQAQRLRSLGPR